MFSKNLHNTKKYDLKLIGTGLLLCIVAGSPALSIADDTEVFFGASANSADTLPNLMFVLDTSGSMARYDGGTQSRMDRMKEAVIDMLNTDQDMNIGLMQYSGDYGGGPVLYPITFLPKITCDDGDCALPAPPRDNIYPVDGTLGDVEQNISGGEIQESANTLDLGQVGNTMRATGFRYKDINIARGATILEARLEFVANGVQEDDADLVIEIEDINNSVAFQATTNNVTDRSFHSETVTWTVEEWYDRTTYQSPDVSDLVQHVVDRDDWCTGSAIAFKITGTGNRRAWQYEKSQLDGVEYIPKLTIIQDPDTVREENNCGSAVGGSIEAGLEHDYNDAEQHLDGGSWRRSDRDLDVGFESGDNRTAGLRFPQVNIPKGVTIDNAYIRLTAHDDQTGDLSIDIYAQDSVNTQDYGERYRGPANVNYYPNPVPWEAVPDMDEDDIVYTSDISRLVQTLIDRADYDPADNAISFQLRPSSGDSHRELFAEPERYPDETARLFVSYSSQSTGTGGSGVAAEAYPDTSGSTSGVASRQARDDMINIVNNLTATGATPTIDAFYEAGLYYRGEDVEFGKRRGNPYTRSPRERFRVSAPSSYTGGSVQRSSRCLDNNLDSRRCRSETITGSPEYISPIKGECQANHIVLLSDGETNWNSNPPRALSLIDDRSSCSKNGNEACGTDLAEWLYSNDQSSLDGDQYITTHTIAYNLAGRGKNFLRDVAAAGGGTAYEASSAADLLEIFNNLISDIEVEDTGFTAAAATVSQFNRLAHSDDVYFAVFKPGDTAAWDGNVKRYRFGKSADGSGKTEIRDLSGSPAIDAITGAFSDTARSFWPERTDQGLTVAAPDGNSSARGGAANQLSLQTDVNGDDQRNVYTWLNPAGTAMGSSVDLTAAAQRLHEDNGQITNDVLDIVGAKSLPSDQQDYKDELLRWARGVDVFDHDEDGSTTDIRRQMGDPMHSRPVIVNYAATSSGSPAGSVVYVGTNQGYLHAINTVDGSEKFAFIPYELLSNLKTFHDNTPGYNRPYGLDGPISVWRDDSNDNQLVDAGEKAYLYAGMRRGGDSYYALDISNPDEPRLAWTIKAGSIGFEGLGQTWSQMTPVKMFIDGTARDVLVFGGGYDTEQDDEPFSFYTLPPSDDKGMGIYIVDARTGALIWSGLGSSGGSERFLSMNYGFNSSIRTIDIDRDGFVDQMYAADVGGQVWRFDVTPYHAGSVDDLIDGGVIAKLSDFPASKHRRFYNEPDVALVEHNSEQFLSISIGSGWRAHPLDQTTKDKFFMLKQYSVYEKPAGYGKQVVGDLYSVITESDLVNVTAMAEPETNRNGWVLDMTLSGEKILGNSVTFDNKVIFTSYLPSIQTNPCAAQSGSGRAYVLDVANGGPATNLDKSSETATSTPVLTTEDRSVELTRSGIPPEAMVLISAENQSEPQIIVGGEQIEAQITNRTRRTFWSDEGESGVLFTGNSSEN